VLEKLLELSEKRQQQAKIKNLVTVVITRFLVGGDKRDRTADLLNAIQALSQLSYTPEFLCGALVMLTQK
jgi:hypothetical protein